MEQKNQYISLSYQLFVGEGNDQEMVEEAPAERPFQFITGFGVALDAFESQVINLQKDDTFDFSIPKEQAYGDYEPQHVLDLEREVFSINGHFDHEHIYEDAIIPLQNEEGQRFYGRVVEVGEEKVKVDLNHPLAGETLHFKGTVLENRPASNQEIEHISPEAVAVIAKTAATAADMTTVANTVTAVAADTAIKWAVPK